MHDAMSLPEVIMEGPNNLHLDEFGYILPEKTSDQFFHVQREEEQKREEKIERWMSENARRRKVQENSTRNASHAFIVRVASDKEHIPE
jgi:hypothetical protein